MENFKRFAGLIIVVFLAIIQLPYIPMVAEANAVQERINKDIDFMPPNPNIYDLKKETNTPNNKTKLSSLSNSTNKKSVAPLKISSVNGGKVEKILVIPIQFKDTPFSPTYSKTYFENLLSGSENSLKDYYEKNSSYKNGISGITIAATVSDIVTSTKDMEYYGRDSSSTETDDAYGDVAEMTREAINILDSKGFDFTQFDSDGDNVIDHIIIIHAGEGQESVNDTSNALIWSHRGMIGYPNNGDYTDGQLVDGVYAYNYLTVSETSTLGTFCHEFGHDLGLPDLYDADGNPNGYSEGSGCWDVMASGSWNTVPGEPAGSCPANLSAWSKMYLGWVSPDDIINNTNLTIANTDGNSTVYRLWPNGDTNSDEYFLAEYRRRAEYDAGLPGEGVLVWHVDKQLITPEVIDYNEVNSNDQKLGVELEQADGDWDLWFASNEGDAGDPFPGTKENYNFIGASYGIKIYNGENYSYKEDDGTESTVTYKGDTLYGANYSNIETDKSTNVELRNISVDGATATMDCSVKVTGSPNKPTIMSPLDAGIVDIKTIFTWGVTADTKAFTLQIAESSDFTTALQEFNLDRTNGLLYTGDKFGYMLSGALENDKTYYWRVAGVNVTGTGAWSDARSFSTTKAEGSDLWTKKADMYTGRNSLGVVSLDGKIYALGGYGGGYDFYSTLEEYDPISNTWTSKSNMPTPRERLGVVALNGKIYAIGGYEDYNQNQRTVEMWDSATDTWYTKTSMPTGAQGLCAVTVEGKIYVMGGSLNNEVEEYNPDTDTWTTGAALSIQNSNELKAIAVNNTIYVFADGSVFEYNVDSDAWIFKGTKEIAYNGAVTELNGKIYFIGGLGTNSNIVIEYDPIANIWSERQLAQTENFDLGAASTNGKIYVVGGRGDVFASTEVLEYIPGVEAPSTPINLQSSTSPSAITITWDAVPNATGYYILADGIENYSSTSMFEHTGLAINSEHDYIVRAVNANYSSDWSEEIYVRTPGAPKLSVDASDIIEGAEDGGNIAVTLTDGIFRTDAFYNRATVSIYPYSIPAGTKQGEVTLVDDTHLNINLSGNSTEDYDTNIQIYIDIAKELITTGRYETAIGSAIILATVEKNPTTVPEISFSFTGENARKLVGATSDMEYSLDGGTNYLAVTEADMELTPTQLNSIDAAKNVRVRIKAGLRTSVGPVKIIDILPGPAAPTVTGENNTDTVSGINNTMEFSTDGINWTTYNGILPDLTGNVTLRIRIPAINQTNAGGITTLSFTYYSPGTQTSGGGVSGGGGGAFGGGGGASGGVVKPTVTPDTGSTTVIADNKITISTEMNANTKIVYAELKDSDLLKALEKAIVNKDGVKEVIVELKDIKDAKNYLLELPASKVSSKTKDLIIEVVTPFGTLALPNDILDSDDVQNVKNIGISISNADLSKLDSSLRKKIGNKPAIEIVMSKDEKPFAWNNPNKAITISLDYKPTADELKDPDNIVVWYIDGKGNAQAVPNGKYDIKTGKVVFTVTHFSKYAVVYNYVKFNDLTRFKWAEKQITVMANKGVINDLADGNFNPDQNISRGMLIDYIIKALGMTASFDSNFSDVTTEDSYYESVGIAKKLGIISGVGQNKFNADTEITRQDMMTILNKALSLAKKISLKGDVKDIAKFEDSAKISKYALESTATMVKEGLITGTGKKIEPTGKVTKAQAAVIAYKCYFK